MSNLGWLADGIARAKAVGGVEFEVYRRPGFTGGIAVRRVPEDTSVRGSEMEVDPEPPTVWDRRAQRD